VEPGVHLKKPSVPEAKRQSAQSPAAKEAAVFSIVEAAAS